MESFKKCLSIGRIYEKKGTAILKQKGYYNIELDETYNPYYDITAYKDNIKYYIECKYNSYTDKTQKIFLECCTRKLQVSGVSITKADYYIFFSNTKYYMVHTDKVKTILRKTIENILKHKGVIEPSGDQLCNYIEHSGLKTKNSIGILICVKKVKKKSIYTGTIKNKK
jgi:hypothetical protein